MRTVVDISPQGPPIMKEADMGMASTLESGVESAHDGPETAFTQSNYPELEVEFGQRLFCGATCTYRCLVVNVLSPLNIVLNAKTSH